MTDNTATILIVDDSGVNIQLLRNVLRRYNILDANNGPDAVRLSLSEPKPDLILLDVMMPGMDGYEVCRQIRHNEKTNDIPIVFVTGQTDPESILNGFEAGAIDYISKPFNVVELKARVKTQLAIKMARDQNRRLVRKIETINLKLTDSIRYAQKIQKASLPKAEFLTKLLPEHFILLKPLDIVSGDFYWAGEVDDHTVIAVADCTGHGVPGAIMSMFGIAFLHEIVGVKREKTPAVIVEELRRILIEFLQQSEESEVKDGMDISIISIDSRNCRIEYAGAFMSVYHIQNGTLTELRGDHMPVSYGEIKRPFKNNMLRYKHGDQFYLLTDGYASQFGGPQGKKLKKSGLRRLLVELSHLSMQEQRKGFEAFFDDWKGAGEQIDDVLMMGLKV